MNKLQSQFSKCPRSRRAEYPWTVSVSPCRSRSLSQFFLMTINVDLHGFVFSSTIIQKKVTIFNCKCTLDKRNTVPFHRSLVSTCLLWREPHTVYPDWASYRWSAVGREKWAQKTFSPLPYLSTWLTRTYLFTFRSQIGCCFLQKTFSDLKVCHMSLQ